MNNDDNEIMLFLRAGGRDWRQQAVGQMVFKIQDKVNKVVHQSILTH